MQDPDASPTSSTASSNSGPANTAPPVNGMPPGEESLASARTHQTDESRKPRKILHVINGESFAGAERVQDLLALRLPDFGYEIGFACVKPGTFPTIRASQSTPLVEFPMRHRFDISVVRQIARYAQQNGYSAIHTHTVRNAMIGRPAAMLARLPVIHHVHSPVRADTEQGMRNAINAFIDERFVQPGAARLIAVSQSLRDYLVEHGASQSRIRVVPNGVPIVSTNCSWRPPEGGWTIGAVALFRPRKGLGTLIETLGSLRRSGRNVRLLAVGAFESPGYESEMKQLAQAHGVQDTIEWAGFTRDVRSALGRIDLMVLPSHYGEGMPMVLLEAMAMSRPIIGSAIEGVPELLAHGEAGMLVPPGDPGALAAAISQVIENPHLGQHLAERAHERQTSTYSDIAMASAVANIYDEVLGISGAAPST